VQIFVGFFVNVVYKQLHRAVVGRRPDMATPVGCHRLTATAAESGW